MPVYSKVHARGERACGAVVFTYTGALEGVVLPDNATLPDGSTPEGGDPIMCPCGAHVALSELQAVGVG